MLLPEPLRPTMPKNSPACDLEGDVLERVELVDAAAAERVQRALLERVGVLVGKAERLADAVDDDGGAALAHAIHAKA